MFLIWEISASDHLTVLLWDLLWSRTAQWRACDKPKLLTFWKERVQRSRERGGGIASISRWCPHLQWFNIPLLGSISHCANYLSIPSLADYKICIHCFWGSITDADYGCPMFLASVSQRSPSRLQFSLLHAPNQQLLSATLIPLFMVFKFTLKSK